MGRRLRRVRLSLNMPVSTLAERSGVSTRTIMRIEKGEGATLENMVRVLRGLGRLPALDAFLPEPPPSPIEIERLGGSPRQRASKRDG